ncbi:3-hydroxyacyl-CoA dehydrogenase family protein [Lysinibacillus halotolerans]|uniref:L-gulonate 3-dehydrogenase n=1 Tax=Lysinibacillus halotolerans TaxID=1368476 RepID=A0A3M8HCZ3_9BACI|nr:3-hydroxyacyl-CoA dehydrogenase family protein [Lysinibacillus halotolerans]RND00338.1 3-hydroxyacyl-CoA dehydrogenase family protein [Lysinibacillus halotolerans]
MKNIGVIGAGTMGFGISFYFAIHGIPTHVVDISNIELENAKEKLKTYYRLFKENGFPLPFSEKETTSFLSFSTELNHLKDADVIIESASENLSLKQELFKQLDSIAKEEAILASNTSSLKLSDIAIYVEKHRNRLLLTHFFNPAQIVPLVELLPLEETSTQVVNDMKTFFESINKTPIIIKCEVPGLAANRMQVALAREALSLLEDGVLSKEDLEKTLYDGPGFRFAASGLLKIIDFGGLDVWSSVLQNLQKEIESEVREFTIIKDLVGNNALGVKRGKGFFEYPNKGFDEFVLQRDSELLKHLINTHYNR